MGVEFLRARRPARLHLAGTLSVGVASEYQVKVLNVSSCSFTFSYSRSIRLLRLGEGGPASTHSLLQRDQRLTAVVLRDMTSRRMDNVAIVVEDMDAIIAFFTELGMELDGKRRSKAFGRTGRSESTASRATSR